MQIGVILLNNHISAECPTKERFKAAENGQMERCIGFGGGYIQLAVH